MRGSTGSQMRGIIALYARAVTLHFYALEHRSMVAQHSPIGTNVSTSVQSRRTVKPTIDGDQIWSCIQMSMVQMQLHSLHLKHSNLNVQQQQ